MWVSNTRAVASLVHGKRILRTEKTWVPCSEDEAREDIGDVKYSVRFCQNESAEQRFGRVDLYQDGAPCTTK